MHDQIFSLKPSLKLFLLLNSLCLITFGMIFILQLSIFLKLVLSFALMIYTICLNWRTIFFLQSQAIIGFRQQANGNWLAILRNGHLTPIKILGDSTVTSFVSILRCRLAGHFRTHNLVIFDDSFAPDIYRKLIVRLKWAVPYSASK